jgi:hypothetical protein
MYRHTASPVSLWPKVSGLRSGCPLSNLSVSLRSTRPGCGSQRLLRCRLHPAGRGPNSDSLFPPLAAVVAVAPCRRGFGSPRKVNGFARGSPTRGAGAQRLRGCTKDSLTVSRSGENLSVIACAMPPPLSRGGLGIPQSFVSSPEAPLGRGAVRRSLTERFSPHHRSQPP